MKAIIAGGRNYIGTPKDIEVLNYIHAQERIDTVISGGASGADAFGEAWAKSRFIPVRRYPADWNRHGKAAGPIRNREMAAVADILIVFPGGRGTQDMIRAAEARLIPVIRVHAE